MKYFIIILVLIIYSSCRVASSCSRVEEDFKYDVTSQKYCSKKLDIK